MVYIKEIILGFQHFKHIPMKCAICGIELMKTHPDHIYCKPCGKKHAKELDKIYRASREARKRSGIRAKRYKDTHKEQYRDYYLFKRIKSSPGCCMVCFETNPFILENHHPFYEDDEFTICLCDKCHDLIHWRTYEKSPTLLKFFMIG